MISLLVPSLTPLFPGIVPTNLVAARAELERDKELLGRKVIRALSARGIVLGSVESAALPTLMAATTPDAGGRFYGPKGLGHLGGPPAEQKLYSRLSNDDEARRVWEVTEKLTGVAVEVRRKE